MSVYATIADLKERLKGFYAELYLDADANIVKDDIAAKDIGAAEAEINASAAVRYVTPVTSAQSADLLLNIALTLAEELAWARGGRDSVPENVKDRAANARKLLERLADGSLALVDATEKNSSAGGSSEIIISAPLCSRAQLKGW